MTTPDRLREWRIAHGLTQTEAATRFGKALRTYQRYENGENKYFPRAVLDALILYSAERHATARKAEQDLNEAYIAKAERMATPPKPEPLPDHWAKLPEAPDWDDDVDDPPDED